MVIEIEVKMITQPGKEGEDLRRVLSPAHEPVADPSEDDLEEDEDASVNAIELF